MEKKEYVLNFINLLCENKFDEMYKYFTNRTVIVFLDSHKEVTVSDFIQYLDNTFNHQEITLCRFFESKVCIKQEIKSDNFKYNALLFEVKDRRISRVEIF